MPGSGERRPLVLLSHLDVVPANRAAWTTDPFAGTRRDGFIIWRGSLDAKGVTVIQLLALTELAKREVPLKRDIVFLATPDEEKGSPFVKIRARLSDLGPGGSRLRGRAKQF